MKKTNKILSIILVFVMFFSIIPITASAAPDPYSGICGDNLTWSFDETTGTLIISGKGGMDDYGYNNRPWEDLVEEIENIVINDGVTTVGHCAFSDCINIKSVTIPASVNTIGEYAFSDCDRLSKAVLPEGVTEIGDGAFSNCDYLDTVVVPGSVEAFGEDVFASCVRLANVTLCDGLTDIGIDTFDNCTSLTDIVIPEGVDSIRGGNFSGCYNLKSITIPVTVTVVGNSSFTDCSTLTNVYYTGTEEDWNKIDDYGNNDPLFDATIHYNSTVHSHNYVKGEVITAQDCSKDSYTTYTCECGHSYKGDYIKGTGHSYDNGVVTKEPTCTVDGVKTFTCLTCDEGQYTETILQTGHSYDDGVVTKDPTCAANGVKTFTCGNCGDTYTETVDKVKAHDYQLVVNTTPETTGCIKTYECSVCGDKYTETVSTTGHTETVIPEFVPTATATGLTAGITCSACGAVLVAQQIIPALGTTDDSSAIVSGTCDTNLTWTYNKETCTLTISGKDRMKNFTSTEARPWKSYLSEIKNIIINDGVTHLGSNAFRNCSSLMYISIPDSVTSMGSYVFYNCDALASIVIPDSVTSMGVNVFQQCGGLLDVTISNSVTTIGNYTFSACTNLIKLTIPDSVYYVYDYAFSDCTNLKSVNFGKNLTSVYDSVFNGCTALTDVYYVGIEAQWNKISIGTNNTALENATIHYNSTVNSGDAGHNHNFEIERVEPTCTEPGYTTYTCECGETYSYKYDALGHSIEEIPPVLPTTETVGYTRGKKCTTCKTVTVEPAVVPIISETEIARDAGYNVIFTYDEATQTMEFYGKGYIKYYDPVVYASNDSDDRPWAIYGYSTVQYVIVHEGIKGINEQNFYNFTGLKMIILPSSLEFIGDYAFEGCKDIYIKYDGTKEDWNKIDGHFTNYDRIIFNDYSGVTASGTHGDNLTWTYDALTRTLTILGTGPMESVEYNEYPWYEYRSEIQNVVIKDGVTTIGKYAFYECDFENVTVPNTVTTIGERAFYNCNNYKSITIPSSVTKIEDRAFFSFNPLNCNIEAVYYLGTEEMWNNISMGSLNILLDDNYATIHFVKYAGYCGHNLTYTFDGSTLILTGTGDMCEFEVDWSGEVYSPWANWALEIEHIVIGDGITSISDDAFSSCGSKLQTVTFGSDVKKIGAYAFYWCKSLTEIIFPDGLTVIGKYAFYNSTSIKSIVLPESIEEISVGAFCDCTGITDVHYQGTESQWNEIWIDYNNEALSYARIHYNSKEVHDHIFDAVVTPPTCTEGGYTTYTCSCGDTYVDDYVYKTGHKDSDNDVYCDVCKEYIYIATGVCGDNLTWTFNESTDTLTISGTGDMYDFEPNTAPWQDYKSSIKKVIICDGVTSLGERAFSACKNLESVTIGNDVTKIGSFAFNSCENLKTVVIGNNVETIGESAFFYCESLTSIIIPDSVSRIGDYAFEHCELLETVTMGSGVEKVGHDAFYLCKKLKNVYYNGSAVDWQNIYFLFGMDSFLANATIHFAIPSGTCGENLTWEYDEKTETLTIFGTGDMEDYQIDHITGGPTHPWLDIMDKVKYLVIDDGVTSIGRCAFYDFIALESVSIANSVEIIGRSAFLDCESLKSIVIPEGVIEIQIDAFRNCTSLTNVTFPSSLLLIDAGAFDGCESLTSVIIPINVQEIGSGAFDNCPNLTDIYYEGTEEQLNEILPIISFYPTFSNATIHYNYGKSFTGIKDDYFYKDDVRLDAYQLVEHQGDFYYISNYHKIVRDKTVYLSAERVEGFINADGTPLKAGYYAFGEDGKMVMLNGVVGDYLYKNNIRFDAYQLVEYEGDFYYIGNYHKILRDKTHYFSAERVEGFTYADGTPLKAGNYTFDANGKMVILNGVVGDYFYKNNTRLDAYQLVEHEGDIYFISNYHKIVRDKTVYLSAERVEGFTNADGTPLKAGYYTFDADGKMVILNGIVNDYFYKNNVRLDAYQLVEYEGYIYFISNYHKIVRDKTVYLSAQRVEGFTNADGTPLKAGYYTFDSDGKIVIS